MESTTRSPLFRSLLVLVLCLAAATFGQGRGRPKITFGDIKAGDIPSPEFKETTVGKAKRASEWMQILVEYSAAGGSGGWLDELTLKWYVLLKEPGGKFLLLETSATYLDIERNDDTRYAVAYIRPGFLRRYFDKGRVPKRDIWIRVEAVVNGSTVGSKILEDNKEPAANWWQAREPKVKLVPDALLTRDQTPFAALDYDSFEHIKPSTSR